MKLLKSLHFDQTARIQLYCNGETRYRTLGQIIYCTSYGNSCTLHLSKKEKYGISDNLVRVAEMLHDYGFYQISKTHIINLQFVRSIGHDANTTVTLTNDDVFSVARRRKHGLLAILGEPEIPQKGSLVTFQTTAG